MQQCMAVSFSEVTSKFLKLTAMVRTPTDSDCRDNEALLLLRHFEEGTTEKSHEVVR